MVYCSNTVLGNGKQSFIFRETVIISRAVIHGLYTSRILNPKQVFHCEVPMFKVFSNTRTSNLYIHFTAFKSETHSTLLDLLCVLERRKQCFLLRISCLPVTKYVFGMRLHNPGIPEAKFVLNISSGTQEPSTPSMLLVWYLGLCRKMMGRKPGGNNGRGIKGSTNKSYCESSAKNIHKDISFQTFTLPYL
jgi:hypothetical protein